MKVLYLVNMKEGNFGGLFKATYERLKRHANEKQIVNVNYYDEWFMSKVRKYLFRKQPLEKSKKSYQYQDLIIHNLNIGRDLVYYGNQLLKNEKKNLTAIFNLFLNQNTQNLSQFDLIHAHWGYPNGYLAYQLSEKYHLPYFITFHGSDINNIQEHQKEFVLVAMENANQCFFVSQQLLENAQKLGYSGQNATVTYNGVDPETFQLAAKPAQTKKVVGFLGALEKVKGADLLPELFATIQESNPTVAFMIVGEGTLKDSIKEAMQSKGLEVDFIGQLPFDTIPEYLTQMDVLVMPSRNEGLGMIILEAHAMGIPVVAAHVGGTPEAIGYPEDLIRWNEDFIEKMAQRTDDILNQQAVNPMKYRQRVLDKFTWEQTVEQERLLYSDQSRGNEINRAQE